MEGMLTRFTLVDSQRIAKEFLTKGFKEEEMKPPGETIEEAVELFDGIVGWLVFFGRVYLDGQETSRRFPTWQ
jgi:AAA+ ATPase superfamily predicted ATPase